MMDSSAQLSGGAMGFGVWLNVVCTCLHCTLRIFEEKDFLGSTLAVRKDDFKGFGMMIHAFSIAHLL